jgi:hypothetical protein
MESLSHVTAVRTRLQFTCCRFVCGLHSYLDMNVAHSVRQQQASQTHRQLCCLCQVREERQKNRNLYNVKLYIFIVGFILITE